jgi:hypothetical protein
MGESMAQKKTRIIIIASIAIIIFVYSGILITWVQAVQAGQADISSNYDKLSRAFMQGQLNLLESPSNLLLKLSDPYDPLQNTGLKLYDISLYKGKYYPYWGPVPALFVTFFHLFITQPIYDFLIVWLFICGLLIANIAIILWMKRRIFCDMPGWFTFFSIFLVGLSNPIPWLMGRPAIYEAAITGGQFFLISGIYWAITGLEEPIPDIRKLLFAGLSWAFAIGTRMNLLFAVSFLILLTDVTHKARNPSKIRA